MPSSTSSPEFSVPVHDLDAGGRSYKLPIRAAWLRGVLEDTDIGASSEDGELDVRVSKSGTDVVVRGRLAASVMVPCSRCLAPTPVSVREEVSALAVPSAPARSGRGSSSSSKRHGDSDDDLDPEDADIFTYDGDALVLDELVRDELLLAIPMIPLCSEGCPGIRPKLEEHEEHAEVAGIDPRLSPLLRLKSKT